MNRRNIGTVLFCVAALAAFHVTTTTGQTNPAGGTTAAPPLGSKVVVVDLVRIFNECQQIADLNSMIKKKSKELNQEAEQRRKVIEDKQLELTAFTPGTPDYEARRKDLVRLNIEANVWLKVSEESMEQEKFEWTRIIYEKSLRVVDSIARERGYEIVVQRTEFVPDDVGQNVQALRRMIQDRTVVYHVPEIDVTSEVVRRLDAEYQASGGMKLQGAEAAARPE